MTIAKAKRFYKQDEKKYIVEKNKGLLVWLKDSIKNGYDSLLEIDEIQNLVDDIANWYEIKYPEREMESSEDPDFKDMESLSKEMTMKQLKYRLTDDQIGLINCIYCTGGSCTKEVYNEKGEVIESKPASFIRINRKDNRSSWFLIRIDRDGKVEIDPELQEYVKNKDITIDGLLKLLNNRYKDELDFKELEECVYNHDCDIELRRKVLQMVALKLLYSKKTNPEHGYERAKKFIKEFNEELDLDLSTQEIDEIINRDYSNGERVVEERKTHINLYGKDYTVITTKIVSENPTIIGKAKQFAKSILKK